MRDVSPTVPDRHPMALTDQRGRRLFAWFPPGTAADRAHVLPGPVYAALCRMCGLADDRPWVAFDDRVEAVLAMAAAVLAAGYRLGPAPT